MSNDMPTALATVVRSSSRLFKGSFLTLRPDSPGTFSSFSAQHGRQRWCVDWLAASTLVHLYDWGASPDKTLRRFYRLSARATNINFNLWQHLIVYKVSLGEVTVGRGPPFVATADNNVLCFQ
jgi:hypothetical protein